MTPKLKKRDLLSLLDLSADEIAGLLKRSAYYKKNKVKRSQLLEGKTLAMIFEKESTRTRISFDVAMYQLGGHAVALEQFTSQISRGETYVDTARVLSRYVDGIMVRTYSQKNLEALASAATVPVINGLSDIYHPCQVLTDLFTIQEFKGDLLNLKISYIGDGNNMAFSWINAALILGFELRIACPEGYDIPAERRALAKGKNILLTHDPIAAVRGADVINTDTWVSMGQDCDIHVKKAAFAEFQVNQGLLSYAAHDAIVLHCLPAHREEEITDEVMDGPQSKIFDQTENRLHTQKAILEMLMGGK